MESNRMIETREQYEALRRVLGAPFPTDIQEEESVAIFETLEALREAARPTQMFGGFAVPTMLKVIADAYESSDEDGIVKEARIRWLRDLANKFAKIELPAWLTEVNND
jgi:hypothetical protein